MNKNQEGKTLVPDFEEDNPYHAPDSSLENNSSYRIRTKGTLGAHSLTKLYLRLVGGLQILYALFFGWFAAVFISSIVKNHGMFRTSQDHFALVVGPTCTALLITSLLAGVGLLRLRPWARKWEFAYLGIYYLIIGTAFLVEDASGKGAEYFVGEICMSAVLTLPGMPVLLMREGSRKIDSGTIQG